jgi:glycosyltransferase involved in cell wall biosynthesis
MNTTAANTTAPQAMTTTFAVVVTCYNYRDFVAEAVDSALTQTRPPKQVIVVDDGSKDGSQNLLRERYGDDPRVTLLMCKNGGQLVAFQRGLAATEADVICFLDADDRWGPGYLSKLGEVYDARADIGFIHSDIALFGNEIRIKGEGPSPIDHGYTALATYALAHWYGSPTSALSLRLADARTCLDVPVEMSRSWRLCADAVLVHASGLMGVRKLYLPTGEVGYRIHGNNGWWSQRSPEARYRNQIGSRSLIEYFANIAGICPRSLASAKLEFRTKPAPSPAEARRYATIAMMGPEPLWKRLEDALSILFGRRR